MSEVLLYIFALVADKLHIISIQKILAMETWPLDIGFKT